MMTRTEWLLMGLALQVMMMERQPFPDNNKKAV